MISNSEQLNTQDTKNEKVEGLTLQENLEPTKAQVEEIIQKMEADISKEENQILESADERIEKASTSSNIDPEKAESIFNTGGFAEKINSVKDKIKTLATDTKNKIKDFVSNDPEVIHFKDMIPELVATTEEIPLAEVGMEAKVEAEKQPEPEVAQAQDLENQSGNVEMQEQKKEKSDILNNTDQKLEKVEVPFEQISIQENEKSNISKYYEGCPTNEVSLENATKLAELPEEELKKMSPKQIWELAHGIRWNDFEDPYTKNSSPEKIFDAEAKLYEGYTPSQELQQIHRNAYELALNSYTPDNLLDLQRQWEKGDSDVRLEICQKFVNKLCESYEIPLVESLASDHLSDNSSDTVFAQYMPSGIGRELGNIRFSKKALEQNDLKSYMEFIVHEMSHAYQDAATKGIIDTESISEDVEWFKLSEILHRDYERGGQYKKEHERYLKLPIEQDAHTLQQEFSIKMKERFANAENIILNEHNLPPINVVNFRKKLSKWTIKNLETKPELDGNGIIKLVEQLLTLDDSGTADVHALFENKNHDECVHQANVIAEQYEEAQKILYKN